MLVITKWKSCDIDRSFRFESAYTLCTFVADKILLPFNTRTRTMVVQLLVLPKEQ